MEKQNEYNIKTVAFREFIKIACNNEQWNSKKYNPISSLFHCIIRKNLYCTKSIIKYTYHLKGFFMIFAFILLECCDHNDKYNVEFCDYLINTFLKGIRQSHMNTIYHTNVLAIIMTMYEKFKCNKIYIILCKKYYYYLCATNNPLIYRTLELFEEREYPILVDILLDLSNEYPLIILWILHNRCKKILFLLNMKDLISDFTGVNIVYASQFNKKLCTLLLLISKEPMYKKIGLKHLIKKVIGYYYSTI